ncbi:MAG: nitrate- and nitrite sensing domain-containing protein [Magnetococcus sp. YQC-3]
MHRIEPFFAKTKWFIVLLPPLLVLAGFLWFHLLEEWQNWHRATYQEHLTTSISALTDLVYTLQKERGYSSGFLASGGQKFRSELNTHRKNTDANIQKLRTLTTPPPGSSAEGVVHYPTPADLSLLLEEMTKTRQQVDEQAVLAQEAIADYTALTKTLLKMIGRLVVRIADVEIINQFFVFPALLHIGEALGKERALLTQTFAENRFAPGAYEQWYALRGEYEAYVSTLLDLSSPYYHEMFQTLDGEASRAQTDHFRQLAKGLHTQADWQTPGEQVDPQAWFAASTRMIDLLRELGGQLQTDTRKLAIRRIQAAARKFWGQVGASIIVLLAVGALALAAILTTRSRLLLREVEERKERELELGKLHYALDQTPMTVVITDIDGNIEYANQTCLFHTGYSREELLGQNPRVLKSGSTSPEAYVELWQTILAGNVWQGEFYNRRKDGTHFWEAASISPIRDPEGNICHFLAIKEEITEKKRAEQENDYRRQLLEQVASGAPLSDIYQLVMRYMELLSPGLVTCLSVVDREQNCLRCVTAPRLRVPELADFHCPAEGGVPIHAAATACAAAAYRKELVQVRDILQDPHWAPFKDSFCQAGLRSCWSMPILGEGGEVLGTLAGYYRAAQLPDPRFLERLSPMAQLIGIAISRQRREEALRAAAERAAAASRAKSTFLANMSHEIRTPLHSIIGALELLQNPEPTDDQQGQLQLAFSSAQTLLFLINDLLDYSKIEARQLQLDILPFNLPQLLAEVESIMGVMARKKQIGLTRYFPDDWPLVVQGDANRLKQILLNLLGNAIKFTPAGGSIHLSGEGVVRHGEQLELMFVVQDTGVGIPEEKRQHIFGRFTQADESITRRFGGTGLGLAICRDLVAMMGGEIGVEANPSAVTGSRFYFTIRVQPGVAGQLQGADVAGQTAAGVEAVKPLSSVSILLVDDQLANLKITQGMLTRLGCRRERVVCVTDGLQAVEVFQQGHFDLVLMDCQMPGMDGYEACRAIREWERSAGRSPPIPIIAFTADITEESRSNGEAVGMNGFLSKPVFLESLKGMLHDFLKT